MCPAPALPAPLSKSTCTMGVFMAKSARAVARSGAWVNRMVGSGPAPEMPDATLANWSRNDASQGARLGRDLVGHIEVEELQPAGERLWIGRVDVVAVDHVDVHGSCLRDGVDERRPLGTGLLVLEGAREEHGNLDG